MAAMSHVVGGEQHMKFDPFPIHAFRLSLLADEFHRLVHAPVRDLRIMWFLTQTVQELVHGIAQAIACQRQTLKHFPVELLMGIASFNTDPSLRVLRQTCKDWKKTLHERKHAIQWTRSVLQNMGKERVQGELHPRINGFIFPLQEFRWLDTPVALPKKIGSCIKNLLTFTPSGGMEAVADELYYHELKDWEPIHSCLILKQKKLNWSIFTIHLSDESLRFLIDDEDSLQTRCVELKRDPNGSFQTEFLLRGTIPAWGGVNGAHLIAWSPQSVFILAHDLCLTEYDFTSCREGQRRDVSHILKKNCPPTTMYMTWYAGYIVLVSIFPIPIHGQKQNQCDCDSGMQLVLLDWERNVHITTSRKIARPSLDDLLRRIFFTFQIYGHPPVHLSLHARESLPTRNTIHLWGTT